MIFDKKVTLKSILESQKGVHLTAYIVHSADIEDIKRQIDHVIVEAKETLMNVFNQDQLKKFLEPLEGLIQNKAILSQLNNNFGIFRSESIFRIVNIPVEINFDSIIATSFHVKPILKWIQGDEDFIYIHLENDLARIIWANQFSQKVVESIRITKNEISLKKGKIQLQKNCITFSELSYWLNEKLNSLTKYSKPKVFLVGPDLILKKIVQHISYKKLIELKSTHFDYKNFEDNINVIRSTLKSDILNKLESIMLEFQIAEEGHRTKKNLFQISKAVINGQVRKLIVTDELSIFGKIDYKTGGLQIHPTEIDHEDDCILDDLAQLVLSQGGEVVIAKRNEIPRGYPILAILDSESDNHFMSDEFISKENI